MTVTELKERMSASELGDWAAYVQEMGPLALPWRIDYAVARAVSPFLKKNGGSVPIKALMPWPKEPEREATLEDVFGALKVAKTSTDAAAKGPSNRKPRRRARKSAIGAGE